jgi:hypothetical protein
MVTDADKNIQLRPSYIACISLKTKLRMRRRIQGTRDRKQVGNGKITRDDVEIMDENYGEGAY